MFCRLTFDTVNHEGLLYKLRKIGISDLFYNIIKNMYNNTELWSFSYLFGDHILCSNYTIYQYTSANRQLFLTLLLDHLHIISSSMDYCIN
jgi:hypothetical protein